MDQVRTGAVLMDENRVAEFLKLFEEEGLKGVTLDTSIEDLDIDSLDFLCLIQEIRQKFGQIPAKRVAQVRTVRELYDSILPSP